MILDKSLTIEWITNISNYYRITDKKLTEKTIRAFYLLDSLINISNMQFIFKGGTALILLLKKLYRLSIDIDILMPNIIDFNKYFDQIIKHNHFIKYEENIRKPIYSIQKYHYKFFYNSAIDNKIDYILLDIVIGENYYTDIRKIAIVNPLLYTEDTISKVKIPSIDNILADKLTAFAPNTIGIPYIKNEKDMSMDIIKQLYDIGNLFQHATNINIIKKVFMCIALAEIKNRKLDKTIGDILDDIKLTTKNLSTKGSINSREFVTLKKGIGRVRTHIILQKYNVNEAIIDASKVAYCVELIKNSDSTILKYTDSNIKQILEKSITPITTINKTLNNLKKIIPEAFFYWYQIHLLENNNNF
jgi:hypothetical protein